jgi:purine-binding chemotaxis protein CheW
MKSREPAVKDLSKPAESPGREHRGDTRQYLSFFIADQEYATDILRVQEIKGWDTVTRVPYTPAYILGVINLRGSIVPVVDLRVRFGMANASFCPSTVVVVVQVAGSRGESIVGVVVDSVSDVYSIADDHIQPPPDVAGIVDLQFVRGLASVENKLVIMLDLERVVTASVFGDEKAAA